MIKLLTYHEIDPEQWSELVQSSPTATWFQTNEAYRFYQSVSGMQAFAYGVAELEVKGERLEAKGEGLPIALGVIRRVEAESYDAAVNQQINEVRAKSKATTFDQLTQTLETWEIN